MISRETINLIDLLDHEDKQVRAMVIETLLKQGVRIVPVLNKALSEARGIARQEIIAILDCFGNHS